MCTFGRFFGFKLALLGWYKATSGMLMKDDKHDDGGWGKKNKSGNYATTWRWRREERGGNWHCGGLLYHLGVGCHVGVFQGIDGAHYTVLTVVGRRLGRERKHSKWNTKATQIHTDAFELKRLFRERGLMFFRAPGCWELTG